jgi:hypothetical protein
MQCTHCGNTRLIQTEGGYKCRNTNCEGFKTPMQPGVMCEDCNEPMEFKGLNSWGEPSYRCSACGVTVKL